MPRPRKKTVEQTFTGKLKKKETDPETPAGEEEVEIDIDSVYKAISKIKGLGEFAKVQALEDLAQVECFSTGHQGIDDFISGTVDKEGEIVKGSGRGFPKGRMVEIFGPESVSKTTLALSTIAKAQKTGAVCGFIDAEHALDLHYASKLGVNVSKLIVVTPDNGEQAVDAAKNLAALCDIVVLDSLDAMVPQKVLDGESGMGVQARLISELCRSCSSIASKRNCLFIMTNQIRMKVGLVFGNPETTSGGFGPKFYASVRMDLRRIDILKTNNQPTGIRVRAKIIKNKVAPTSFRETVFDVVWGKGVRIPTDKEIEEAKAAKKAKYKRK